MTLDELLVCLNDLDLAAECDIDPTEVVGILADKVDAIKTVLDRLEGESERLAEESRSFKKAADQVARNRESLRTYVAFSMARAGFEKLPGKLFRINLVRSESTQVARPAMPEDYATYPEFVRKSISYAWDKAALKDAPEPPAGLVTRVPSMYPKFSIKKG